MPPPPLPNFNHNHDLNTTPDIKTIHPRTDTPESATQITNNAISIPSTYGRTTNPPNAGVVVGATLGAVFGFVLLLYLIYLALTSGRRFSASTIVTSTTPSEIVDVRFRDRPPGSRSRSRAQSRRGRGDEVIVEESLTDGTGVVEVIEEESVIDPPPSSRWRSRSRSSRSRSGSSVSRSRSDRYRRRGGVREVDPRAYGGGSEFSGS